jgi:hypothetical protein
VMNVVVLLLFPEFLLEFLFRPWLIWMRGHNCTCLEFDLHAVVGHLDTGLVQGLALG